MAIRKLFSILDKKAQIFMTPFFQTSEIFAQREVMAAMQNSDISLNLFAEDYELFLLGEFDDVTAKMRMENQPKFIVSATTCKNILIKKAASDKLKMDSVTGPQAAGGPGAPSSGIPAEQAGGLKK